MDFNKDAKELCLGLTLKEIKELFESDFDPLSKQIYYFGAYYQLLFDEGLDGEYFVADLFAI